jgi:ABC-type glycerol-3-phosphate transport system substrate-binding protein
VLHQRSRSGLVAAIVAAVLVTASCTAAASPSPSTETASPSPGASPPPTAAPTPTPSATLGPPQTVTFWQFSTRQQDIDAFTSLITKFEALHPNITIKMELVPWADQQQKLTTALASGGLPDVSELGNDVVAQYEHIGALAPLDQYFAAESAQLGADITTDFWPGDSLYYHLDGKWWGSPVFEDVEALYYRTDLFTAAGLDPAKPPTTWDQMKADAALLTKSGVYGWGALQSIDYTTLQSFMSVYLSYGARYLNAQGQCGFDTPEFKQALDYWTSIFKAKLTPPDSATYTESDMDNQWETGKVAMFMESAWLIADTQANAPNVAKNMALAPIPGGPQGTFAFLGGVPLVLWNTSKVKDAAAAWITFATSADNVGVLDRAAGELPGRKSQASQAPWNAAPWKVFVDQLANAVPYQYPAPEIPQMGGLEVAAVQTAVQSVALGKATLDQAAQTLCSTINKALSQ